MSSITSCLRQRRLPWKREFFLLLQSKPGGRDCLLPPVRPSIRGLSGLIKGREAQRAALVRLHQMLLLCP